MAENVIRSHKELEVINWDLRLPSFGKIGQHD